MMEKTDDTPEDKCDDISTKGDFSGYKIVLYVNRVCNA